MRFRPREIIFVCMLLIMLGGTYMFVFSKTNAKRQAYLADMKQKQKMLNDLHVATVGVDDINAKTEQASNRLLPTKSCRPKKTSTASSRKLGSVAG